MVYELLRDIYDNAENECVIDIAFNVSNDGQQLNPCRSLLQDYLTNPTTANGRTLAERLGGVTTKRSGLGLLFLVKGQDEANHKIVVARFPAKSGILAEEGQNQLSIEYLERVFMRSATAYKAVLFAGTSIRNQFWIGKAVDRQINSRDIETSAYWIVDFLDADLRTTSALGTRRLAIAIRDAARHAADLTVKQEIVSAVTLAAGLNNQVLSPRQFVQNFALSNAASQAIFDGIPNNLLDETFRFDRAEFMRQVPVKSVKLDNGALLMGQTDEFEELFDREEVGEGQVRFSTTGRIISEKLEKIK
ncbi:hypothetical protein [Tsuneonella mangrovi]|uniref:hypothetical protein n=1 Tax=Tsuneonella mangrovi TaxID=1982042 RepID=UPI000BA219F1|nr:hypothetical protein [Tsuneonella mangrovi]